jgi:ABC-type multidrug transport system fused ATPase/permease subunit
MIAIYRKLFDLLDARERRRFYQLLALIILTALVDMVGVASILPFLAVIGDPSKIRQGNLLTRLYDMFGFTSDRAFLVFLGGLVFAVIVAGLVVKSLSVYAIARFSHHRNHSIGSRLLRGYLNQPYVWFLRRHSADLGRAVLEEVNYVIGNALIPALRVLAQAVLLICLTVLLFLVNPAIAMSSLAILGGSYLLIFLLVRRLLNRLGKRFSEANQARFKIAQEAIGGIKDVKLLGLESAYLDRFRTPSLQLADSASASQAIGEMPRNFLETIAFGGMVLLIVALLVEGDSSLSGILPMLGVFAFAGLKMFPAVQQIYHSVSYMRYTGAALDNVHRDTLETAANRPAEPAGPRLPPMRVAGAIEMDGIGYTYPQAEKPVLTGLSLTIPARTTVGIVGGTGAGKTTAVDIMLGLLTADAGTLRVDGQPITPANLRAWQDAIGYVPQQIFLVDDSVAANIAFGIPADRIDMAAVERAARVANLHDFVMADLPQGYQTAVGERGVRLSGGQRQRIGIARALYHDPEVLILDEATSALDNLTERAVMEAVHNLGHEKTIVMIAHRLSTVKACDTIFLLENGRCVAEGPYDRLVAENEMFRRMATG